MPRVKKSRKVTKSAPRPKLTPTVNTPKRAKKSNGKAPGNRNSLKDGTPGGSNTGSNRESFDKRLGSKRKISLLPSTKSESVPERLIPKFKTPAEELNYIENDAKLQTLMDKLDNGKSVDKADQLYVERLLERHKILCELLGIVDEDDSEDDESNTPENSDDLLDMLEKPPGKYF